MSNFLTLKIVLKLQIQAPKEANFYESQRIALKLIHYAFFTWKSHAVLISDPESGRIYWEIQFLSYCLTFFKPRGKNRRNM